MSTTILKTSSIGANPALDAKHLLDTISQAKNIAIVLDEIRNNHGDKLPKYVVKNLELLSQSANHMHKNGRRQVVKVSPVSNLLQGYDMRVKSDRGKEPQRPINTKLSDAMWRTREYVSKCNSSETSPPKPKPVEVEVPFQSAKKPRRSERAATITPEKERQDAAIAQLKKGIPPMVIKCGPKNHLLWQCANWIMQGRRRMSLLQMLSRVETLLLKRRVGYTRCIGNGRRPKLHRVIRVVQKQ